MEYVLIVDNGLPYEEIYKKRVELLDRLNELRKEDNSFLYDVWIYQNGKDITKRFFKVK